MRSVRAALGAASLLDCDLVIDLPEHHPTSHAALQLDLMIEDDIVRACDPRVGLMHRSVEKLFEARDYRQVLMLASRHDWLGSFNGEHGAALVIEEALGITPPERARWSRTLLAEMSRLTAALAFLAPVSSIEHGQGRVLEFREALVAHLERATGNRVHPMITRIGGLGQPLDAQWLTETRTFSTRAQSCLAEILDALAQTPSMLGGLALLDREHALALGVSGPVGRASGIAIDARTLSPADAYPACADLLLPCADTSGDAHARFASLAHDALTAVRIIDRCVDHLEGLGEGPIDVSLPKVIRVPQGHTYRVVETPLGLTGFWLLSDGGRSPWRLKLRTPSFSHVQAMAAALVGTHVHALGPAIASFFLVVGDIDR